MQNITFYSPVLPLDLANASLANLRNLKPCQLQWPAVKRPRPLRLPWPCPAFARTAAHAQLTELRQSQAVIQYGTFGVPAEVHHHVDAHV